MRPARPRRSELATPAGNEHMFAMAAAAAADQVFLDLEDACDGPTLREHLGVPRPPR